MKYDVHQGDILKIENINMPVLVVSTDFFNQTEEIIGCPIYKLSTKSPLHIQVIAKDIMGYVQCEKLTLLDLKKRGYIKLDRIKMNDIIDITDAIQGIFDYL